MCATAEIWEPCWHVSRPELHARSRDVSRVTEVWIGAIEFNVKSPLTSQLHAKHHMSSRDVRIVYPRPLPWWHDASLVEGGDDLWVWYISSCIEQPVTDNVWEVFLVQRMCEGLAVESRHIAVFYTENSLNKLGWQHWCRQRKRRSAGTEGGWEANVCPLSPCNPSGLWERNTNCKQI